MSSDLSSDPMHACKPTHTWEPEYDDLWPNPEREWLLRAAFSEGEQSGIALNRWRELAGYVQYDQIDYLSCRILPLVYKRLQESNLDDPWMPKLRALHRYHWAKVKTKQQCLVKVIDCFDSAGIPTLVLKGHALLASGYYADAGERPLNDLDVMIRPQDVAAASDLLSDLKWTQVGTGPHAEFHAYEWQDENGIKLDLHRKLLPPPYHAIDLDHLLSTSQSIPFFGRSIRIPDPTHLLMHCLVHGRMHWGEIPKPFLWVADTLQILAKSGDEIDWARLVADAKRFAIVFDIRESLGYIKSHFGAVVPDTCLDELNAISLTRSDLVPFFRWTTNHEKHSILELKDLLRADFHCHQQLNDKPANLRSYLPYLARRTQRLITTEAGGRRWYFLKQKAKNEGIAATVFRPDYAHVTKRSRREFT
ncbi:nucleotidyltransferase family protein [Neorhodopirellula lusitana]|uniref:nucleotidyltransferase family protein n=1 Tax=Neorhodopirellula lusitana TaxID=445327 RepID=UPI00384E1613